MVLMVILTISTGNVHDYGDDSYGYYTNLFITVLLLIIVMENSQVLRFSPVYEIQHPDVCNVSH